MAIQTIELAHSVGDFVSVRDKAAIGRVVSYRLMYSHPTVYLVEYQINNKPARVWLEPNELIARVPTSNLGTTNGR